MLSKATREPLAAAEAALLAKALRRHEPWAAPRGGRRDPRSASQQRIAAIASTVLGPCRLTDVRCTVSSGSIGMIESESLGAPTHEASYTEPPDREEGVRHSGKGRQAFRSLRRELSEEELQQSGTVKMILDQHDQLERENDELRRFKERFHVCDKGAAVLRERLNTSNAIDILLGAALVVGSLLLGNVPSLWSTQPTGWLALVAGAISVVGAVVARLRLR